MKKLLATLFAAAILLTLAACSGSTVPESGTAKEFREFTDSTGRTVTLPAQITKIAITGPLSQVYILPLGGDMLVGVSTAYAEDAQAYLPAYIYEKTEIGQLYGGKGEMDLEALLTAAPDVVIDIGEPKKTMADDLTALTEQTGIPFIHVDATVATAPDAYRILGKLLGREEKAEELAHWCENTYAMMEAMMEKVDADGTRRTMLYCLGDKGVNVIAEGSFHAETVNMMSKNLAVVEEVVSSGAGNEVDLEQILLWDPDVIIFAPDSCYDTIADSSQWQSVGAVARGDFYKTPTGPYGWLSSPPAVQRYLGMLWLGTLLYPEYAEYDLQEAVTEYYKLFYGCELTGEMYRDLVADALT
ncbi:MAG: ABC transporter substrate-binding protein [Oscillospiraceae bacterium]|nr:ABC transporter substrate-binding protein [Oscillospiraceae bacterium]